jgi:hypothetical protein
LDLDPRLSKNSEALDAQNKALEAHNGGLEAQRQNGVLEFLTIESRFLSIWWSRISIRIRIKGKWQRGGFSGVFA